MRFTLKTLLAAIAVAAVFCAVFFTLPALVAIILLGMIWIMAPPALIAGIVYGRGYGRAFAIGCVSTGGCVPLVWLYSSMILASAVGDLSNLSVDTESAVMVKLGFGVSFFLVGLSGLISMSVRWLSLKMATPRPDPTPAKAPSPQDYSVLQRRISTLPAATVSADESNGPESANKE